MPGKDKPASSEGTPNDATPESGWRSGPASTVNNDVNSYFATDKEGNKWVLSVAQPSHTLSPGYVLRGAVGKDRTRPGHDS